MGAQEGKIAIVTGTTSGMGRACALRLAAEGATVIGFARRAERHEELRAEIAAASEASGCAGSYVSFVGDITKPEDIKRCAVQVLETYEKVDILVNCTGVNDDMFPIGNLVDDEWFEFTMNVNLMGPMRFMREVVGSMVDAMEGVIINVSSVGGIRGCRAGAAYTAAKHGIIGATLNTAYMYANDDIRCNAICPGAYGTECVPSPKMDTFGFERCQISVEGMPNSGDPVKIANLVNFLASEEASDINGAVITSDFGWTAM